MEELNPAAPTHQKLAAIIILFVCKSRSITRVLSIIFFIISFFDKYSILIINLGSNNLLRFNNNKSFITYE